MCVYKNYSIKNFNLNDNLIININEKNEYCGFCQYFGDRIQCPYFDIAKADSKWIKFHCNNFL